MYKDEKDMFYKHWKKIALAIAVLFWAGCSDDSSSNSKGPIACELDHMWSPDDPSCTNPYSCKETYYCHDDFVCYKESDNKTIFFDCRDENGNKTIYNEDEFNSKYYVKSERIH